MEIKNYTFICTVDNFSTLDKELNFGDFTITKVRQGSEAGRWRKKLQCKGIPRHIFQKKFSNYVIKEDDISGVDNIIEEIQDLLTCFRLFDIGDMAFRNYIFVDEEDEQSSLLGTFNDANVSPKYNYSFNVSKIDSFNEFRKKTVSKPGFKNKFFQFALSYFMKGVDKGFFKYDTRWAERVVDYFIALESLFLIDGGKDFLGKKLRGRIKKFLPDDSCENLIKNMYGVRSKVVHGDYVQSTSAGNIRPDDKEAFEWLIRRVFLKMFDYNFEEKAAMAGFAKDMFDIPKEILDIMSHAREECDKKFGELEKEERETIIS